MKTFSTIYKENQRSLSWFISKMVQDSELTKDLTQLTFMKALEKLDKYDEQKSSMITWLCKIAHNVVIDHKRLKRTVSLNFNNDESCNSYSDYQSNKSNNPEEITSEKETIFKIVNYLRSLPILNRRIGLYRFLYDKKITDIATELNIPVGTVKVYSQNIRKGLKLELA